MTSSRATRLGVGLALALAVAVASPRVRAQTADELTAARALFQEAFKDEHDKRYEVALDKFQRVAKVRESAAVRYRIASCLEALGRYREARDAFRALAAAHDSLEKKDQDIADSAAGRAAALDKRMPRLIVRTPADAPPDTHVSVNGTAVPTGRPIEVDPGDHVVQATATGKKLFEGRVRIGDGAETPYDVTFAPTAPPAPPQPPSPAAAASEPDGNHDLLAYVALGTAGTLVVTGITLLMLREADIRELDKSCPNGVCPADQRLELEHDRDQAKTFGPLGIGLTAVGAAAAGVGVYLVVKSPSSSSASASRLRVGPRLVHGGALLGVGTAF